MPNRNYKSIREAAQTAISDKDLKAFRDGICIGDMLTIPLTTESGKGHYKAQMRVTGKYPHFVTLEDSKGSKTSMTLAEAYINNPGKVKETIGHV